MYEEIIARMNQDLADVDKIVDEVNGIKIQSLVENKNRLKAEIKARYMQLLPSEEFQAKKARYYEAIKGSPMESTLIKIIDQARNEEELKMLSKFIPELALS